MIVMGTFSRLIQFSRPYWRRIAISLVATLGVAGLNGAIAFLIKPVLEMMFVKKDLQIFLLLPIGVISIYLIKGVCRFTADYFISTAGQLAIQDIREGFYRKNMSLSMRFFNNNPTGALMSRVLNDVSVMQEGVANIVTGLLRDGFSVLGLLGVIFYRDWQLALVSFVVIPLTIFPARKIGKRIKKLSTQSLGKIGDISRILQETFSGIKVVKAFGLEGREVNKFVNCNREFYHITRKAIKYGALSSPIMEVISSLGIAAVIWFGGSMVLQGKMTSSEIISFMAAMIMLYNPIKGLLGTYNAIQRSFGAAERVFEILDEEPEIQDGPDSVDMGRAVGNLEFDKVSFCYNEELVLKDVSLSVHKGEVVAFVGPSGGGKTTLASLIPRFYDVTTGSVSIDGVDIRKLKLKSLMAQIAMVDQETFLFNDTITNNIRYGKPEATLEEVYSASRAAFSHDFIMEMPEGYDTTIGDRGVRLSGGQRQRICIARAILKDAPILVLDEATSALDTESEQMVQQALNNLMANRTTLVIAHRLSTIFHADKIAVLDKGEIVQMGSHAELIEQGGLYKKLYEMQFA
jgi:subfamily B ATP-binding cassette protein MsbA